MKHVMCGYLSAKTCAVYQPTNAAYTVMARLLETHDLLNNLNNSMTLQTMPVMRCDAIKAHNDMKTQSVKFNNTISGWWQGIDRKAISRFYAYTVQET